MGYHVRETYYFWNTLQLEHRSWCFMVNPCLGKADARGGGAESSCSPPPPFIWRGKECVDCHIPHYISGAWGEHARFPMWTDRPFILVCWQTQKAWQQVNINAFKLSGKSTNVLGCLAPHLHLLLVRFLTSQLKRFAGDSTGGLSTYLDCCCQSE